MTQSMYRTSTRTEQVKHVYQFAGYISCIHCGLKLRCDTGNTPDNRRQYYHAAKARRMSYPSGGNFNQLDASEVDGITYDEVIEAGDIFRVW
ncbi:MAG TPA: hypothetical protein VFB60_01635 [Ktedonobacteraceae bacterium]|nr:hypothetical protein [Ktedonobacteraceae bacterium]